MNFVEIVIANCKINILLVHNIKLVKNIGMLTFLETGVTYQ